jgi:stage IV sporulation protein FB
VFFDLRPTPYDLKWRMFGIPVRVHPSFWLVSAFFSWPYLTHKGFDFFFLAIACVFVTLLIHELGHALTFRFYRTFSAIVLYSFGGLAIPEARLPYRPWRIIVSLAGPGANFLLAAALWGSNYVQPWALESVYLAFVYLMLFNINLFLGLLNLMPVWPLDGGQVSRELWMKYRPYGGLVASLRMSMAVAIAFAAYAVGCEFDLIPRDFTVWWLRPGLFAAVLFALLAAGNYMELQNHRRSYADDRAPWER